MAPEDATALIREAMPLCATLGIRVEEYTADHVILSMAWSPSLCTSNDQGKLVAKVTQTQMVLRK